MNNCFLFEAIVSLLRAADNESSYVLGNMRRLESLGMFRLGRTEVEALRKIAAYLRAAESISLLLEASGDATP